MFLFLGASNGVAKMCQIKDCAICNAGQEFLKAEAENQNKKDSETTTMATPMTIPTLSRLRDVSGRLVRRASSLLQEILELNMMAQQVGLNQEEIIQTRLSSLRSELESLVELQNTLKKIGQEHSETMSQLRDDSACL